MANGFPADRLSASRGSVRQGITDTPSGSTGCPWKRFKGSTGSPRTREKRHNRPQRHPLRPVGFWESFWQSSLAEGDYGGILRVGRQEGTKIRLHDPPDVRDR